ncbi:MAG: ligase-associated DNA damage response DEXH box helicase [Alphaproteobacteria bacterium]|nr:MAG: ligase-associated DNA damage response DEXH box helicase [Alphaproteobacteria bacterium]
MTSSVDALDVESAQVPSGTDLLPPAFQAWFEMQGWRPRAHQLELLALARQGHSSLLIAPTGGGKTLAGFLPTLTDLASRPPRKPGMAKTRIHTLYISPLKALAVDIARNLERPVSEMDLPITIETRTGDTPPSRRQRQRYNPPDILLTTPEQLALLLSHKSAGDMFRDLKFVVLDELHALVDSKRGELLSLGLARLSRLAPDLCRIGLSATVAHPQELRAFLLPQSHGEELHLAQLVQGAAGAIPQVTVLSSEEHIPWSGHSARHAAPEILNAIKGARIALIFVNTRSQAELIFQELWRLNEEGLAIALHHGSLSVEQRRKVESAMTRNELRAVVCTSTLDLGIDWGEVDLVINVGAPKGASRLLQRIGRANHRWDEPSRALLIPSNRFEVLECEAAREAAINNILDGNPLRRGGLDVLAQHVLGMACAEPFDIEELFLEVASAKPYHDLTRDTFQRVIEFVINGGYALRTYERFRRLAKTPEGKYRVAHPSVAQKYRLNVGTIVAAPLIKVRVVKQRPQKDGRPGKPLFRGGRYLGEVEEYFIDQMAPGDTFIFAGHLLRFEGLSETECYVTYAKGEEPKIPAFMGGKFPLSTYLSARVRAILADEKTWGALPPQITEWLSLQKWKSVLPGSDQMLVEVFPRGGRFYLVCYPFEGRLAHQSLGMLLTRRLERLGLHPLGFVANEYALSIWGLRDLSTVDMAQLFDEDMMGDDLEAWLAESSLMKRTFRDCAVIAGLIEQRFPGQEKTSRQMTISSDLLYDVLHEHEPDHILLQATWNDASAGLLDLGRLGDLLKRIKGHLLLKKLDQISPLAVPVMLEIGRVPIFGDANEAILKDAAEDLIAEAMHRD